jgi:hypothetical protein
MSDPDERRQAARILSEFALVLDDEKGALLDDRALAHDVSDKGFKAETRAELKQGQVVRFHLTLGKQEVRGRARIVWCHRTDLSFWAGAQFVGMSWSDRRRVRKITSPSEVDWVALGDKGLTALLILLAATLAWAALSDRIWRSVLSEIFPKMAAAVVMGFALRELLRPRR